MKPTNEQIETYKEMAKNSQDSMSSKIKKDLEATCDKFNGNEDKLERCIEYLTNCAREILDGKNGEVSDDVCYKICRDYFNDEIWKKEDEEKAEQERLAAERKNKSAKAKKNTKTIIAPASVNDVKISEDVAETNINVTPINDLKTSKGQLDMFAEMEGV